jgi:hypothetical protein
MSEKRVNMEKVGSFIDEAFRLSCLFAREIVLIRIQTNRKLPFLRNRKFTSLEEFRTIVFKEFEDGIRSLHMNTPANIEIIAKNEIDQIKKGNRPKLQKMIDDSYKQLLKESQPK